MARPNIDKVEIVEPPIGELTKRHGNFKQGCVTGCGCIVIFIIGSIIGLRLLLGKGPSTIKTVPPSFPTAVPLYDKENIEQMTLIPGKYKSRGMEIAALFPKIILSPLINNLDKEHDATAEASNHINQLKKTWNMLLTPVADNRTTVQIEWNNMNAEPQFVLMYYANELTKADFTVTRPDSTELDFRNNDNVSGTLVVKDEGRASVGTDYALLTVNYPDHD